MTARASSDDVTLYDHISMASMLDTIRGGLHYVLVGAGGNGARLVPPLMQILHATDHLSIIDHDVVEDRNLGRQHFSPADVGRYKALVLAERYRRRVGGQDMPISAHTGPLAETDVQTFLRGLQAPSRMAALILLGCVDNAAARRAMRDVMRASELPVAWIDVGNAFKDGQVVLSLRGWPMNMKFNGAVAGTVAVTLRGMEVAMPQLLVTRPEDAEEVSCRDRVDLQSVMINMQAASAALNVASWLKLKSQIHSCGAFFTSACSMQPIALKGYSPSRYEVIPDTAFAAGE